MTKHAPAPISSSLDAAGSRSTDIRAWFCQMMVCRLSIAAIFATSFAVAFTTGLVTGDARVLADVVKLKSGGELRGKVLSAPAYLLQKNTKAEAVPAVAPDSAAVQVASVPVVIQLSIGGEMTVRADQVAFITPRSPIIEDYETQAEEIPDTVEAHWELANWARQKGLTSQREDQLREVIRLDPDHEKAHLALNHTFQEGKWVDRDEWMMAKGYVKYKGRYITLQELELLEKSKAELEAEQAWFPKIRLWQHWLASENATRRTEGIFQFEQLTDPNATTAIEKFILKDDRKDFRMVGVTSLSHLEGERPAGALARAALFDEDLEIRFASVSGVKEEQLEKAQAYWVRHLRHDLNPVVCRAGRALFMRGNDLAVDSLIDALVTHHMYQIQVPVNEGVAGPARSNGGVLPGTGQRFFLPDGRVVEGTGRLMQDPLSPKAMKTVTIQKTFQNEEVREALSKITGQNFGFDQRTWRLWRSSQKAGL